MAEKEKTILQCMGSPESDVLKRAELGIDREEFRNISRFFSSYQVFIQPDGTAKRMTIRDAAQRFQNYPQY